jgi:hypothetical protein
MTSRACESTLKEVVIRGFILGTIMGGVAMAGRRRDPVE